MQPSSAFQERVFIKAGGNLAEQLLRYERGGVPLPFSGKGKAFDLLFPSISSAVTHPSRTCAGQEYSEAAVSPCSGCGSKRIFELQIMPQVVTMLSQSGPLKEQEDKLELGWATVFCFCCAADCEQDWSEEASDCGNTKSLSCVTVMPPLSPRHQQAHITMRITSNIHKTRISNRMHQLDLESIAEIRCTCDAKMGLYSCFVV